MKRFIIALLILSALIIADVGTTVIGLSRNGINDLNPIYYAQGFQTFMLVKLGFIPIGMAIYAVVYRCLKARFPKYAKVVWGIIAILTSFYIFIVINNLIVLLKTA